MQPQPAINGFLFRRTADHPELLFQGRVEPGNIDIMQLAPTVQSTEANYKQLHGGRETPFVDWFTEKKIGQVLIDELQSEEGSRYHGKYNRNIVIEVPANLELPLPPNCRWYSVDALRTFVASNNILNTDARSVLACMDWGTLAENGGPFIRHAPGTFGASLRQSYFSNGAEESQGISETLRWLAQLRVQCSLRSRILPITALKNWKIEQGEIREECREAGFAARHFAVVARGREVSSWDQPLIDSAGVGLVCLVAQRRCGMLQFLIKASYEIGFLEGVQLSASLCINPGQTVRAQNRFESELFSRIEKSNGAILHMECRQSEEGGRFYQDENRYQIVELTEDVILPESEDCRWMTLGQIRQLISVPGTITIEARGALAGLLHWI